MGPRTGGDKTCSWEQVVFALGIHSTADTPARRPNHPGRAWVYQPVCSARFHIFISLSSHFTPFTSLNVNISLHSFKCNSVSRLNFISSIQMSTGHSDFPISASSVTISLSTPLYFVSSSVWFLGFLIAFIFIFAQYLM